MEDSASSDLTDKQQTILDELEVLGKVGIFPTVRSLSDRLEGREHRSERWTGGEVRGLLERLEEKGEVEQFEGDGAQRYRLVS
jgi:hypothetical protein